MQTAHQRPVFGEDDMRVDSVEVGQQSQQRDLTARQLRDVIEVDDAQQSVAQSRGVSRREDQ